MRVLVVVHGFPPAAQGGSEIFAFEHARALTRLHGDDVLVLTREQDASRPEYSVRRESRDGLSMAWVNNTFRSVRSFEQTYRQAAIDAIAARLVDEFRPDVAHIHHLTCLSTGIVDVLAERAIPSIVTLHDYWLICHRGQLLDPSYRVCEGPEPSGCAACVGTAGGARRGAFAGAALVRGLERKLPETAGRALRRVAAAAASALAQPDECDRQARARLDHMRRICERVSHFLAPSRCMRERFIQFGLAPERVTLSPYGFDHRPFREGRAGLSRRNTPTNRLRLGFLGSLMISKAPHVLLEAAARFPVGAVSVDLFGAPSAYHGDASYGPRLEALLRAEGVTLRGPIPHERVPDALASIDLLVVPSIWPENSPLVIQEAFLAGVPVIASRIGGIPEVVEDGKNGLLFESGDSGDLGRVLARLIAEPALVDRLRAGIPPVRSIEDDVKCTRAIYEGEARAAGRSRQASRRRVAAVVLNYRTADETLLAVRSLLASRRAFDHIIVVDNDSAENCRSALDPVASKISYILTGRNLGFSGGVNAGIRAALDRGADAVMLVNSDVIVPPDCIAELERSLDAAHCVGIAAPIVLARTDPGRVASLGMTYDERTGRMRHRAVGADITSLDVKPKEIVAGVSGCSMLIDRAVFEAIGLFDEEYFFTFEDLDFCLRARRAGFDSAIVGAARVYHEGSRSMGAGSPLRLYFATRNHLLMASKNGAAGAAAAACRTGAIVMLNLAHAAVSSAGPTASRFRAVAQGLRDYMAGTVGAGAADGRSTR